MTVFVSLFSLASEMDVGFVTKTTLKRLISSGDVASNKEQVFHNGMQAFFLKAYEYAISHLPVDDPVLLNAEFVRFEDREHSTISMPQFFVER